MRYNRDLLTPDEEIVREFRTHWRLLVIPLFWGLLGIAAIVATWLGPPENDIFDWAATGLGIVAIVWYSLRPFINWFFRFYVLTTERLITRAGVLARRGFEMPLENINDVHFSQNILERVLKSGDLIIESAGEQGQSKFTDIPDPEEFQSLLYRIREHRHIELSSGGSAAAAAGALDPTAQLAALKQLYDDGILTAAEYEEKRQGLVDRL